MKLFGKSKFIEIYDNALSKKECEILIDQFEKSPQGWGMTVKGGKSSVNFKKKKCKQLDGLKFSQGSLISDIIKPSLFGCIDRYRKKHSALDLLGLWRNTDSFSFQKYEDETDGYKNWHTEHGGGDVTSKRILVWMFYLNNAKSGTDFYDHPNVQAKRGRCVIWPAGWEYFHRSTLNKGLKYIVTGWMEFAGFSE